ncbi:hypothetical protein RJ639_020242 [Escallonia herrerae]|uniref:DUF4283 domain-containing protein n=1 Tax=Escallonia herrerae TaxID=1293975 RepID=A0AA88V5D6_9ASTE|nr:hypothetical protein RJ639_020242 [Escallonia herrerae]
MSTHQLELDSIITKTNLLLNEEPIELEEDDANANIEYSLTILAKVVSIGKMNSNAVQVILSKACHPPKGMKIQNLDENIFCITFNHEWDRKRILDSRSWSILSSHLVVRDWPPDLALREVVFDLSPFWVRICGLPPNQMTKIMLRKLQGKYGFLRRLISQLLGRSPGSSFYGSEWI